MNLSKIKPKPRILVVDDAPENLIILNSILVNDYSLKFTNDSAQALVYADEASPDLILLDIMMPGIDGFEVCRQLKKSPNLADVPIIFITANKGVEYQEKAFAIGASDFIHKPISAPIVKARIKTHIKIKFMMDLLKSEKASLQLNAEYASAEMKILKELIWGNPMVAG